MIHIADILHRRMEHLMRMRKDYMEREKLMLNTKGQYVYRNREDFLTQQPDEHRTITD